MIRQRQLPQNNGIAEFDPFAAPEATSQPPDESPVQVLHKIHRLLRGRYILAISLAAAGALAGAAGGYFSTGQKWQSIGAIRVEQMGKPVFSEMQGVNSFDRYFDSFVRDQVGYLAEQQTIDRAMLSDPWRQFNRGLDKQAKREFRKALTIDVDRDNPKWIKIRFIDPNPQAAQAAVQQVVDSYKEIFGSKINLSTGERISALKADIAKFDGDIKILEGKMTKLGENYGTTDLATIHTKTVEQLTKLQGELADWDRRVVQARAAAAVAPPKANKPEAAVPKHDDLQEAPFEIAKVDPTMAILLAERARLEEVKLRRQAKYSPASDQVQDAVAELARKNSQIAARCDEWLKAHNNVLPGPDGVAQIMGGETLEFLEGQFKVVKGLAESTLDRANAISNARIAIDSIQKEIQQKREERAERQRVLSLIQTETGAQAADSNAVGRVNIISSGEEASLYSDSRKKLAALGFLLGGSLPIFGVMLFGAMDRRYRYSDDAGTNMSHVPLLGILPYIPESIDDPDKAGVAAHCVHQIRTLLQIGGVEHDRKVFAITSATSGDGKTSLCLSLGLSFAASGASTLLIDFDMIGGGLTAAMGARTDVGLLAALDDGQLEGHVRPTAFPRLSIIPSGRDDAQEISRLSPKHVRRLIDQARKEYDVVVIDTGPILGSIEATLVCGVADGVVLALGRGQHKSMALRAIQMLRGVGAHVMGVVFNRAQPNDFKRSVSQSVRSVPAQSSSSMSTLKALPAIGPMARTVASHIRPDA